MVQDKPGLAPRKLEGEVAIQVESNRFPAEPTVSEQPSVQEQREESVSENTETPTQTREPNVEESQVEQPLSSRAEERIRALDDRYKQAEAEKTYWQRLAQSMTNVQQQQPALSEQEQLSKTYKTYDATQGYPTDPKEYAGWVAANARAEAQKVADQRAYQLKEQQETQEFVRAYPDAVTDPILMGAVAALRANAQNQGVYLSYKDAADQASKQMNERVSKKVVADVANNDRSKDEAYVESTRGASAVSRTTKSGSQPDLNSMSLEEMEAYLKQNGAW